MLGAADGKLVGGGGGGAAGAGASFPISLQMPSSLSKKKVFSSAPSFACLLLSDIEDRSALPMAPKPFPRLVTKPPFFRESAAASDATLP